MPLVEVVASESSDVRLGAQVTSHVPLSHAPPCSCPCGRRCQPNSDAALCFPACSTVPLRCLSSHSQLPEGPPQSWLGSARGKNAAQAQAAPCCAFPQECTPLLVSVAVPSLGLGALTGSCCTAANLYCPLHRLLQGLWTERPASEPA